MEVLEKYLLENNSLAPSRASWNFFLNILFSFYFGRRKIIENITL